MNFQEKFFNIFNDQIVGANVVYIKKDNLISYKYGYQSINNHLVTSDDTIYRIASISKLVVGVSIMKLAEDSVLSLDQDISTIFGYTIRNPKFPLIPITVRMLMLHTSSITDGLDNKNPAKGYDGVNGKHYLVTLEDLLINQNSECYTDNTFSSEKPGTKYIYSNFGYGILACIIEILTKQLFTKFVSEFLFTPLKMDASFKISSIVNKDKISDTFTTFKTNKTANDFINGEYPDFPLGNNFRGPAGGMFTSAYDLSKIMMLIMNDGTYNKVKLLTKESIDELFSMNFFSRRVYKDKNLILHGYSGGAYGVCSLLYFSSINKTGVCFIANGGNYKPALSGLNTVQEAIIEILLEDLSYNIKKD